MSAPGDDRTAARPTPTGPAPAVSGDQPGAGARAVPGDAALTEPAQTRPEAVAKTRAETQSEGVVADTAGPLVGPADGGIATLPPIKPVVAGGYPVSVRTGEPRRPGLLVAAVALLLLGSVVSAAGLLLVLWDAATVVHYHEAARLLTWTRPDPVSKLTTVLVLTIGLVGVLTVGAPAAAAYNAWNGDRRTRWLGLAAVGLSLLSVLLNTTALLALAPVVAGAVLLWLPPVSAYVTAWSTLRQDGPAPVPQWATNVVYGPLPRYR